MQSILVKHVRDRTQHIELKGEEIIVSERVRHTEIKKKKKIIWYKFNIHERPKKGIGNIERDYVRFIEKITQDAIPTYWEEYHPIFARIRDAQIYGIKQVIAGFLEK